MKLISMTDFVLDQSQNAPLEDYHQVNETFVNKVVSYAYFLKQPLTLGMFVPCYLRDGVWIPYTKDTLLNTIELFNEFEKAKERVLFDFNGGINLIRNKDDFFIIEDKNGVFLRILKGKTQTTVGTLFKFSVDITLTPYALKQIGL